MKRCLLLLVVAIAVALAACKPPPPPPPPPPPAPAAAPSPSAGFDTCAAPSTSVMTAWKASPYTSVGVYIGGANRGCSQPNLTKSWVSTVTGQGWRLLPIWVGPQAPCTTLGSTTKITADPGQSFGEGAAQGSAAANAAQALGLGWLAPVYYDMEAYPRGGQCSAAVQNFIGGWVQGLNARGYRAGFYSSLCSGILDEAAATGNANLTPLNAILDRRVERHAEHLRVRTALHAVRLALVQPPARAPVLGRARRSPRRCHPQHRLERGRRAHRPVAAGPPPAARSSPRCPVVARGRSSASVTVVGRRRRASSSGPRRRGIRAKAG